MAVCLKISTFQIRSILAKVRAKFFTPEKREKIETMKNSVEFAFYVEKEPVISRLNSFMLKDFKCKTHIWSDEASHNMIVWLLRGSARYVEEKRSCSIDMSKKVISIKRGSSYIIEAEPDAFLLTYSFDDYLPFDTESLHVSDNERFIDSEISGGIDISPMTYHELRSVITNFSDIQNNEALTFISLQKVMLAMMKSSGKVRMTRFFAPLLSRRNEETAKYARLINFSEKNFKKSAFAYNLKV